MQNNDARQKILDRLNRIEGQIRGIKKMIEDERECFDVMKQVAAVNGAVRSLQKAMMTNHLEGCLIKAMDRSGDREQLLRDLVHNLGGLLD
jgi:DNA-binding FrmR family transcriptional regulator